MGKVSQITRNTFLTLICLGLIAGVQAATDKSGASFATAKVNAGLNYSNPLVPSANTLKVISLNQPQLAADVLWLDTIQYFGAGNSTASFPSLGPILNTITALDPKFEEPYEFGIVILPLVKQTDTAIAIGNKATHMFPTNGLLDFYHASNYLLYKKDYANAALYYQKAAKNPGSPSAAVTLAGTSLDLLRTSINDRLVAISYWQTVEDNAKNADAKQQAENQKNNMVIVYQLEKAAAQFKSDKGHFPESLQELLSGGYITIVPESPIGRPYRLSSNTGIISSE